MDFLPNYPVVTERLSMRPFQRGDIDAVFAYRGREDVAKYLLDDKLSRDECARATQKRTRDIGLNIKDSQITLAVETLEGQLVGEVCLILRDVDARQGEMGWIFNPDYQGKGYATEACKRLMALAFGEADLHRVYARCDAENAPSWRLMERLGMRREAHFKEHALFKGRWDEELYYAILKREWRAQIEHALNI